MFFKNRIMLIGYRLSVCNMHTELSKIVQNLEESQVFLYEESVCSRKSRGKFYAGSKLLSPSVDCRVLCLWCTRFIYWYNFNNLV